MRIKDVIWITIIAIFSALIIVPQTRTVFESLTTSYPYGMGFIKTAILASMGEILVNRIRTGYYFSQKGIWIKFIIWGLLGMIFVLIFKVFAAGVVSALNAGLLPVIPEISFASRLLTAFLISFIMNIFFAPTFMLFHRITDGFISIGEGKINKIFKVKLTQVIEKIDFRVFISFVVFKTIPLFWIPAHTITFLLPENYRVLMAAYLSIILGFILTMSKTVHLKKKVVSTS